jgi:hypothetical protein
MVGIPVSFLTEIEVMPDEKRRTGLFMNSFDGGIAEIDVGINDVGVVGFEPGKIGGADRAIVAWNDERETPAPSPERFGGDGIEHCLPVLGLFDEISDPDGTGSNISFHIWYLSNILKHTRLSWTRLMKEGLARSSGILVGL